VSAAVRNSAGGAKDNLCHNKLFPSAEWFPDIDSLVVVLSDFMFCFFVLVLCVILVGKSGRNSSDREEQ
jgi:hypothetical protein